MRDSTGQINGSLPTSNSNNFEEIITITPIESKTSDLAKKICNTDVKGTAKNINNIGNVTIQAIKEISEEEKQAKSDYERDLNKKVNEMFKNYHQLFQDNKEEISSLKKDKSDLENDKKKLNDIMTGGKISLGVGAFFGGLFALTNPIAGLALGAGTLLGTFAGGGAGALIGGAISTGVVGLRDQKSNEIKQEKK